jgi:hypothetical protein
MKIDIATKAEAIDLAVEGRQLKQQSAAIDKALREWISENEGIEVDGELLDFHDGQEQIYPDNAEIIRVLKDNGVSFENAFLCFKVRKKELADCIKLHAKDKVKCTEEINLASRFKAKKTFTWKKVTADV